jgi:hypothetical protein
MPPSCLATSSSDHNSLDSSDMQAPCPEIGGKGPVNEKTEHTKAAEHG